MFLNTDAANGSNVVVLVNTGLAWKCGGGFFGGWDWVFFHPFSLHQEQGTSVCMKQCADILEDLVAQRPNIQLVTNIFHLKT